MTEFFMVSFAVATVLEIIVVTALIRQIARQERGKPPAGSPVLNVTDLLTAAGLFGGTMVIVNLVAHGWQGLDTSDIVLFAATFGIVTAAAMERLRSRSHAAAMTAYAIPLGFGVIGGIVGAGL
ncbi:hypothetical protein [Streptomyces wuyuanensis]|uniref:hypothetical protein n=1 Tax=Streptomyces wuyuanensis TaxID=1196353 RepID=UPI0038198DCC